MREGEIIEREERGEDLNLLREKIERLVLNYAFALLKIEEKLKGKEKEDIEKVRTLLLSSIFLPLESLEAGARYPGYPLGKLFKELLELSFKGGFCGRLFFWIKSKIENALEEGIFSDEEKSEVEKLIRGEIDPEELLQKISEEDQKLSEEERSAFKNFSKILERKSLEELTQIKKDLEALGVW
jgi:hypothetical protein